tara:strand:+ start:3113 stop:3463 length:351 start_codon:yes stop_codon:yes gene_type:complete
MKIKINKMKLFGYHGLYDIEKENGQDFIVNIVIESALQDKCGDNIEDMIDYVEIAEQAKVIFYQSRYNLIETLAIDISEQIMKNSKVDSVNVSIKKVAPPIDLNLESIEVEYSKER